MCNVLAHDRHAPCLEPYNGIMILEEEKERTVDRCLDTTGFGSGLEGTYLGVRIIRYIEAHQNPSDFEINMTSGLPSMQKDCY